MVCGSMVTVGAHAFEQGAPAAAPAVAPDLAGAAVEPLVLRDAAPSADAADAITQAVVDALSAHKPRAFSGDGDADGMRHVPVSYAAPIAVATPRREDAVEADSAAKQDANDEASRVTNEAVIDEALYAVDAASTPGSSSSPQENDVLAQRDAVEHQDAADVTAAAALAAQIAPVAPIAPALAQEAEAPVQSLPVSYAAPIAVAARKGDNNEKAEKAETPRARQVEEHAQAQPTRHEQRTLDATPTPPPVSPAHEAPVANARVIVKPPVSYARPIAVPVSQTASSVQNDSTALTNTSMQTAGQPQIKERAAPPAQAQVKAPLSYAAPIAVPQASRDDTPPERGHEVKARADTEDPNWSSKTTVAISEEKLDSMRGGFDVANGLKVSFGVSRMAVVNGNLVTQTSFNIPDLSNMTTQQAQALASANIGSLLQNGGGNIAQQGAVQGLSGAVIQNTLSNQNIQTLTTINASVNSLGLFKSMNLGATLNNALMNSIRPR
ncbi:putative lipoprotein [Paraburkholderia caribensis MBA4]|uniref:Putative lipoprotein n=2 Tax=Paraburkholderia caribensis TaxID=75105 RepID=A0A0P0RKE5_9BURK|nr:putative lipoprotein [Paraburkholderia caribensis MBA4]